MADPLRVNRDKLYEVFGDHETVIQFENLFSQVEDAQDFDFDSSSIDADNALSKANAALGLSRGKLSQSYETVNKNLQDWDKSLSYTGLKLNTITYSKGGKTITKTYNYTGNQLSSVVLSGDTPSRINLTKSMTYSGLQLTNVAYT